MNRRTPPQVSGHTQITTNFDTAYVAMFDVGDAASADSLGAKPLLSSLLAQAWLTRDGSNLPDWLQEGFGLMEAGVGADSEYLRAIPGRAGAALSTVDNPALLFNDGTFAPEEVGPVGYMLVRFLISRGGAGRFQQLVGALRADANVGAALQQAYGQDAGALGQAFLQSGR
jgi:hypothetical protein